jgi:hypothetical protein
MRRCITEVVNVVSDLSEGMRVLGNRAQPHEENRTAFSTTGS